MSSIIDIVFNRGSSSASTQGKEFDYATFFGIIAAFGLVLIAISLGGGGMAFINLKSLLIVVGGTLGATLVTFPLDEFQRTISVLKTAFLPQQNVELPRINRFLDLSRRVRLDGVLAIQNEIYSESDPFVKKCIMLLVDGYDMQEIRKILEIELNYLEDRHRRGARLFQTMGSIAPAMGLIGTLIGLVQMLGRLDDPAEIGPAMAVALLTTFYGACLANLVFIPLAGKLRTRSEAEALIKELTIEATSGIAEGLNPRMLEQRLLGFLAPEKRLSQYQ